MDLTKWIVGGLQALLVTTFMFSMNLMLYLITGFMIWNLKGNLLYIVALGSWILFNQLGDGKK